MSSYQVRTWFFVVATNIGSVCSGVKSRDPDLDVASIDMKKPELGSHAVFELYHHHTTPKNTILVDGQQWSFRRKWTSEENAEFFSRCTVDEEKKAHHVTPDLSYCWGRAREQCEDNKSKWDGKK